MYFIVLLVICVSLLYIYATRNSGYWRKLNIPFIQPVPFFGNIFKVITLQRSIGDVILDIHDSVNAKYVGFFMFDHPILLIRDPDLVKRILIKDFDYFEDRSLADNKDDELSANILFIVKQPLWKTIRSKVTPVFTSSKMKRMLPHIVEASEDLKYYINEITIDSNAVDIREIFLKYTTDVISSCAFGINAQSFKSKNAQFWVIAKRMFDWTIARSISMSAYFISPMLVKVFKLHFVEAAAGRFLKNVFWKHMKEREESKSYRGDLVDLLIELRKSDLNNLEDKVLLAQAVQFFFAGFETTGTTLAFVLYCLAKHPDIQREVREEVKEVLQLHENITYDALKAMQLLDRVISESLRMFPLLTYLDRRCTKPYQLPGTDIVLNKGIPVIISVWGLHYNPQIYPEPSKFNPDRFTEENKRSIPSHAYLAFGDGPRNCIGSRFALLTVKVAMVQIISEFEVETCPTTYEPMKFEPRGFTLTPNGGKLYLRIKKYPDGTN